MPNRIIKESICTSEDIDKLSKDSEILFYRLLVQADDFGCYFGNPSIVKSKCFPLKTDEINSEQVACWLEELENSDLIIRYTGEDGRKYLCFRKWGKHQSVRATKRKFPAPPQLESNCKQLKSDASKCPRNPIQSNPIQSESNSITNAERPRTKKKFVPPTLEEVTAYVKQRNSNVDPKRFFDFFQEGGWIDSNGKQVSNWKQKIITWEGRSNNGKPVSSNSTESTEEKRERWNIHYDNE